MPDMKKRLFSAALCGALCLSMGLSAAADAHTASRTASSEKTVPGVTAGAFSLTQVDLAKAGQTAALETSASESAVTGTFDPSVYGYTNLGMVSVTEGNVNIRENPDPSSKIVGKAQHNDALEITGSQDGFLSVTSGEVTGWIKADYVLTGENALKAAAEAVQTMATVTGDGVNVRAAASTDSEILGNVTKDTSLAVLGTEGDFTKVDFSGQEGYIATQFVSIADSLPTASTLSELAYGSGVADVRVDLVNYALQFVGNRYVWGGTSLEHGIDCSGFTMQIYRKYGISLPHHAASQAGYGRKVSAAEAQPGDLVFYGKKHIHHVAIYIGNGQIVHAASKRSGIKISNMNYSTPCKIVSLLN